MGLTCKAERRQVLHGVLGQLSYVHRNRGDGVGPHAIRNAHEEPIVARRGLLLDDHKARALVQDEVAVPTKKKDNNFQIIYNEFDMVSTTAGQLSLEEAQFTTVKFQNVLFFFFFLWAFAQELLPQKCLHQCHAKFKLEKKVFVQHWRRVARISCANVALWAKCDLLPPPQTTPKSSRHFGGSQREAIRARLSGSVSPRERL